VSEVLTIIQASSENPPGSPGTNDWSGSGPRLDAVRMRPILPHDTHGSCRGPGPWTDADQLANECRASPDGGHAPSRHVAELAVLRIKRWTDSACEAAIPFGCWRWGRSRPGWQEWKRRTATSVSSTRLRLAV
jgi:hypothetical protein